MMRVADREYRFDVLTTGPIQHILRLAVLWVLANLEIGKAPDWAAAFAIMRKLWRKQVRRLQQLGWEPARYHPGRLRNCCPAMCYVKPAPSRIEVCNMDSICPDCYARARQSLIDRVLAQRADKATLQLFRCVERIPLLQLDEDSLRAKLQLATSVLQRLLHANDSPCAGQPAQYVGAYWAVAAEPRFRKQGDKKVYYWRFESRLLVLLRKGGHIEHVPPKWTKKSYRKPGLLDYNEAMSAAIKYPQGLLCGPAAAVQQLLAARKGLRLSGVRGVFRGEGDKRGGAGGGS